MLSCRTVCIVAAEGGGREAFQLDDLLDNLPDDEDCTRQRAKGQSLGKRSRGK